MAGVRWLLGLLGVGVAAFGVWSLLTTQSPAQWVQVALWLAAGVLAHDALIAALALGVGVGVSRLPRAVAAGAVVALVLLGSITLIALPALVRSRDSQVNPTLLPRDYGAGWLWVALVAVVIGAVVGWATGRRTTGGEQTDVHGDVRRNGGE